MQILNIAGSFSILSTDRASEGYPDSSFFGGVTHSSKVPKIDGTEPLNLGDDKLDVGKRNRCNIQGRRSMENLSPMRLSMGSQFFLSPGLMMGTNRPSAVFESAENMYTDSYPANDSRNSFSNRFVSSQLPSVRQAASSVSLFTPFGVGESSLPTDWGQSNTNMPVLFNESGQPDLIDKPDRESSRDPAFFNQFFNEMPPVREDLDFGNGRISELSVMEHDRRPPEVCVLLVVGGLNYAVHPQGNFPSIMPQKLPTSSASVGISSPAGMATGPFHAPALDEASYKESGRVEPEKSAAPQSLEDKKREKMERNRESARKSRKRRKQYQQLLDSKVSEIIQELDTEKRNRLNRIATSFREQVYACCYHQNMTVRFGNALNGRRTRRLAVCFRC